MISFSCSCGERYQAGPHHAGHRLRCRCGTELTVPSATSSPLEQPPQARSSRPAASSRVQREPNALARAWVVGGLVFLGVLAVGAVVEGGEDTASRHPASETSSIESVSPPPATPEQIDRCAASTTPSNGKELLPRVRTGHGVLTIENGTPREGVAVLVQMSTGKTFRVMYVAPRTTAKMYKVDPGTYRLQFTLGTKWLQSEWRFCNLAGMTEFEEPLAFHGRRVGDGFRVTFHEVKDGNAETADIPPSRFALPPR